MSAPDDGPHEFAGLPEIVGARLAARNWKLVTAESCTGGMVAAAITGVAGSSAWFDRGFITYSNKSKIELLAIPGELLAEFGAVSKETARAMAQGALLRSDAQIAVAVTGIAGPGGGVPGKPVGTIAFGWAILVGTPIEARIEMRHFDGDRSSVRRQSVLHALSGLLEMLSSVDDG